MPIVNNVLNNISPRLRPDGANVLDALGYGKHEKGRLADRLM